MQRVKHSERRKETRRRLELGEAVEAGGGAHLSREEIIAILQAHVGVAEIRTITSDKTVDNGTSSLSRERRFS